VKARQGGLGLDFQSGLNCFQSEGLAVACQNHTFVRLFKRFNHGIMSAHQQNQTSNS
jgi:hypothetical protein